MPDSENIGGINVEVTATDADLDAVLARAEAKIKEWATRVKADAKLGINVGTGATGRAGTSGTGKAGAVAVDTSALEKKIETLASAITRGTARDLDQARKDANAVTLTGGTVRQKGGQSGQLPARYQQAIDEALAQQAGATDGLIGKFESFRKEASTPVVVAMDTRKAEAAATRVAAVGSGSIAQQFDTSGIDKAIDKIDLLSERLTMLAEQAKEPISFNITDPSAASGRGGGGGSRRARGAAGAPPPGGPPPTSGPAPDDEEGEGGGNVGGRIGILRQPDINEYQNQGPYGNRGGRINFIKDVSGAPAIKPIRDIRVVGGPRYAAAVRVQKEQTAQIIRDAKAAQEEQRRAFDEPIDNTGDLGSTATAPLRRPGETRADELAARQRDISGAGSNATRERAEAQRREEAERLAGIPQPKPYELPVLRGDRTAGGVGGGRGGGPAYSTTDIDERETQRVAIQEAQRVSAGRTARTQASSVFGFGFGGGRGLIEAQAQLEAANKRVTRSDKELGAAREFANRPEIRSNAENYKDATLQVKAAEDANVKALGQRAEALKRVQSFSGLGAGIRNLAAVTVGGAAFGLGLEGAGLAMQALEKAATPYFDAATGYAQKTATLTAALADQARQQQGNAQGVVALQLAQAGYAQSTAQSIQPIIANRVQIEAGNKALQDQIDTFRVAEQLRTQGANAGLGGGTGGVLGTGLFAIPGTGEQTGNFLQTLGQNVSNRKDALGASSGALFAGHDDPIGRFFGLNNGPSQISKDQQALADAQAEQVRGLQFVNDQLDKGGDGAAKFQKALSPLDSRIEQTAKAFDNVSPEMAAAVRQLGLFSDGIKTADDAQQSLRAINRSGTLIGPDEALAAQRVAQQQAANSVQAIQSQQEYERPGFLAGLQRQQQVAIQTQIPANAALANLAAPPTPVGTGILGANAKEQAKINSGEKETIALQGTLNNYYDKGKQILLDTYQIPPLLVNSIQAVGQEIAGIQASISNEQASYAVAQYNYQLFIAKRTLGDIGGLTAHNFGAGETELGVLERQNLLLGRQGQLLQFNLSQRQLNFQRAVAGFTVPGLTPAEQNARVSEAKITTSYAQKQLDIQRQMFGNQVKIVDITNLRQGADLVKQIGLLQQGRKVTIDTALAQEKLTRLQKKQDILTAEAGTYITKVNAQIAKAEADMEAIESATGHAISQTMKQGVVAAYAVGHAFYLGVTGGFLGGGGTSSQSSDANRPNAGGSGAKGHASGFLGSTHGLTPLGPGDYAGEANGETVAILRNPRRFSGGGGGGGGGSVVNFFGDIHIGSQADMDTLVRKITQSQGRTAALKGLRSPN